MRVCRCAVIVTAIMLAGAAAAQAQAPAESHRFTTSDGAEIHYLEAGNGPMIVFVPGWTMPAEIWQPQIEHFTATHRVIAMDPRGQGRSEKVDYGYVASRRAQDIGELLDHLGGGPAALVGWSLGAHEVLEYTRRAGTEHVSAVVLVDHPIRADWSTSSAFRSRYAAVQNDRSAFMSTFIRAIFATPQPEPYLEAMTAAAMSTPENATAVMIGNLMLVDTGDLTSAVDSLDKPLLFVTVAGRPASWSQAVREHKPDASVVEVTDAGHALFVDQPEQFNAALEDFLRRVLNR